MNPNFATRPHQFADRANKHKPAGNVGVILPIVNVSSMAATGKNLIAAANFQTFKTQSNATQNIFNPK